MLRLVFAAAILFFCILSSCLAVEVGYKFTGSVSDAASPFGIYLASGTTVVGRFIYDTGSPPTHHFPDCGDCTGYRQQIVSGFSAMFGDVPVRADDYVASVSNDTSFDLGEIHIVQDVFDVTYDDTFDPAPSAPLVVDGINESAGWFTVSLSADSEFFHDSSLPMSLNYSQFEGNMGVLGDGDGVQAFFSIDSLVEFPVIRGDYDGNGVVNGADYDVWKLHFGSSLDLAADGNRSGQVDAADYTVWRDHFGAGGAAAHSDSTVVPEPSGIWLCTVGVVVLSAVRGMTILRRSDFGQR